MDWFPQFYIILNLIGSIFCTALSVVIPKQKENVDLSFNIFIFSVGCWCFISALFFLNTSIEEFWFWNGLLVITYTLVPVLWLNFVSHFTRVRIPPIRYFFCVPILTLLVYWIKPLSFLMWRIENYRVQWGFPIVDFEQGLWFKLIHSPYCYALVFTGLGILVRAYLTTSKTFKDSYLVLLVIGLVPLVLNGITLSPIFEEFRFFDLTPLGYVMSSAFFCIATSRYWLIYRSPLVYEAIFSSLQNAILVFDASQQLVEANPAAKELLKLNSHHIYQPISSILPFLGPIETEELHLKGQTEVLHAERNLEIFQSPIKQRETLLGCLVTINDLTQARQLETQLLEGALLYDSLTNLPNRQLFQDRLEQATRYFKRRPESPFAVLFLDLDRFKVVNDSLGHGAGDKMLIEISKRLVSCLREHDTVARLGGDEFAILAENVTPEEIEQLCYRIQTAVQEPLSIDCRKLQTSVSIGIAFSSNDVSADQILQNADLAMYQTKNKGKAGFTTYDYWLHNQLVSTMQLEVDIKNALSKQEFFVEFQPIVCLQSSQIKGFESLVRWAHPHKGEIPPVKFITVAEEIGLISELDHWVFIQACHLMSQWNQRFVGHQLTISVNLSVANFVNPKLTEIIVETLEYYNVRGEQLKLEITESLLMDNPDFISKVLNDLKNVGLGIQLDDFGTGHSSLSYLHQLPLDALKIDRSFVMNAHQTSQSSAIIKSIVDLAHNLQLQVIGEGVESEWQRQLLQDLGCQFGQGYFWTSPQSPELATAMIARQRRAESRF